MSDHRDRVATPFEGWAAFDANRHWGGDSGPIEQWFESGEEIEHELTLEEADRWERVVKRMRLRYQGHRPTPAKPGKKAPAP